MTRCTFFVLLSLALALPARAQTDADFFNDDQLDELRLYMHFGDWRELQERYKENVYYPADLHWRGIVVRNIAVRSRGNGTRSSLKAGLRVDINRYASDQEFLGLKSFVLDNHNYDASMLHERLAMRFFQRMGMPAPRARHVKLYVNNEPAGVYSVVESIDKHFLARVFGERDGDVENDGYLFEYRYHYPYDLGYLGRDLDLYSELFEPRTHETDAPVILWAPLEDMIRTINEDHPLGIVRPLEPFLDVNLFVRYVAIETFLAEYDGILGHWGMNNFYLYRFEGTHRFQFLPWDKDYTFMVANQSIWWNVEQNVLLRQLMDVPELRALYLDTLVEAAHTAADPVTGRKGWLESEIERAGDQIRVAAKADRNRWQAPGLFDDEFDRLREFATTRSQFVLCEVQRARDAESEASCAAPENFPQHQPR
jgi:hypothetical protein